MCCPEAHSFYLFPILCVQFILFLAGHSLWLCPSFSQNSLALLPNLILFSYCSVSFFIKSITVINLHSVQKDNSTAKVILLHISSLIKEAMSPWHWSQITISQESLDHCSVTVTNAAQGPKESWGGKGLFSSHSHLTVHHWRKSGQKLKQGRNLEAGVDTETMEGCCLLTGSSLVASLLSYRTQDHQPRG